MMHRFRSWPRRFVLPAAFVALASAAKAVHAQRTIDLDAVTITEIGAAMDAGTLTAEQLVRRYLARIAAYDANGPKLHAILALNPRAIEEARALDAERKSKGRRSPLHGIPFVLKDNFDTKELPTTGGSVLLEGHIPAKDAFVVQKLRDAGAILLAKVNMSEFASGGTYSSLGGQTLNPHDLARSPSGSSGGTGASVAAAFAQFGLGTDTGGSIRGPATVNGIVALKPTHGLMSRSGIIPLALTFDTGGPMTRNVTDLALVLGAMTGIDAADSATRKSEGHAERDYTKYLRADALAGARIGIDRDFMGADVAVDWVTESSLDAMRRAGATIVDVRIPKWVIDSRTAWYNAVRFPEFGPQIAEYLEGAPARYPKSLAQMIERVRALPSLGPNGSIPNTSRWSRFVEEASAGTMDDYRYRSVHDYVLPMLRELFTGIMTENRLDAIVYPTKSTRPDLIAATATGSEPSATNFANLTGFPDLTVPAGFSEDRLPIGLSFFGLAWSEGKLISLAYSFEQLRKARRLPVHTPPIAGTAIPIR